MQDPARTRRGAQARDTKAVARAGRPAAGRAHVERTRARTVALGSAPLQRPTLRRGGSHLPRPGAALSRPRRSGAAVRGRKGCLLARQRYCRVARGPGPVCAGSRKAGRGGKARAAARGGALVGPAGPGVWQRGKQAGGGGGRAGTLALSRAPARRRPPALGCGARGRKGAGTVQSRDVGTGWARRGPKKRWGRMQRGCSRPRALRHADKPRLLIGVCSGGRGRSTQARVGEPRVCASRPRRPAKTAGREPERAKGQWLCRAAAAAPPPPAACARGARPGVWRVLPGTPGEGGRAEPACGWVLLASSLGGTQQRARGAARAAGGRALAGPPGLRARPAPRELRHVGRRRRQLCRARGEAGPPRAPRVGASQVARAAPGARSAPGGRRARRRRRQRRSEHSFHHEKARARAIRAPEGPIVQPAAGCGAPGRASAGGGRGSRSSACHSACHSVSSCDMNKRGAMYKQPEAQGPAATRPRPCAEAFREACFGGRVPRRPRHRSTALGPRRRPGRRRAPRGAGARRRFSGSRATGRGPWRGSARARACGGRRRAARARARRAPAAPQIRQRGSIPRSSCAGTSARRGRRRRQRRSPAAR